MSSVTGKPEARLTKGITEMKLSLFAPALIAGAFAAGIALAPAAAADDDVDSVDTASSAEVDRGPHKADVQKRPGPNAGSSDFNNKQIPQGWRNDALWGGNPSSSNPFGSSKVRPPVIALD